MPLIVQIQKQLINLVKCFCKSNSGPDSSFSSTNYMQTNLYFVIHTLWSVSDLSAI